MFYRKTPTCLLSSLLTLLMAVQFAAHSYAEQQSIVFSPDGKLIASRCYVRPGQVGVGIFESETGKQLHKIRFSKRFGVEYFAFSPDGKILAGVARKTVDLWDVQSGTLLKTLDEHHDATDADFGDYIIAFAFSRDSKRFFTATMDNSIKTWETNSGEVVTAIDYGDGQKMGWGAAFSSDTKLLARNDGNGKVNLYRVEGGDLSATMSNDLRELGLEVSQKEADLSARVKANQSRPGLKFSSDDKYLATVVSNATNNFVVVWDVASTKLIGAAPGLVVDNFLGLASIATVIDSPHVPRITTARPWSISQDWKTVAIGGQAEDEQHQFIPVLCGFETASGKLLGTIPVEFVGESITFAPDGKSIAASNPAGNHDAYSIWIIDIVTGKILRNWETRADQQ